ncbi:MAG: 1-aminocyclopropane-carboxylate deaminase [Myxococcaceae bacterium]|nr:1-aminocyclopropane-carboxylate deaminase [Myxococcaceae bacterium]
MQPRRPRPIGRRAFLAGSGVIVGCAPRKGAATRFESSSASASADASAPPDAATSAVASASAPSHALFDAYPALAKTLARVALGRFPAAIERATSLAPDGTLYIKRDDDFTRSLAPPNLPAPTSAPADAGGGKVRKLELYFGEARAQGKRRIITSGGVGSNQALAVALLGRALGFSVRLHLTPQPLSSLTTNNLGADAATGAELRLFDTVYEGHARATRDAQESADTYVIPPGGTTPLGTLGFVNAGLELAADVRAGRMPAPRRVYVALGLGGSAAGLGLGCALGGLRTEIVAVRASSPGSVTAATLRAIHDETVAFAHARDPSFPKLTADAVVVRIDGRFVGAGYGAPSAAGNDAIARAHDREGWDLDPVYTGKALAALLDDLRTDPAGRGAGPLLFWNTMSSRPVAVAAVPAAFRRFTR